MEIEIFALCEGATATEGKLNILGALDTIRAYKEPILTRPLTLVARLRFMRLEDGEKKLRIAIVDMDGREVIPMVNVTLQLTENRDDSTSTTNLTLEIQRLELPKFGEYSVDLAIDGRQEASIPIYARRILQPEVQNSEV